MAAQKSSKKGSQKKGGGLLFSVALGAALAAAAGYYATHKEEVDREAKKRIDQLAKAFKESRPLIEKRVREVWGEVSEEAVATYLDVRGALLHALEEENLEKTGKLLRKEYDHLVELAVQKARKSGLLNKDIEKKLEELFKMDWKQIQAILAKSAKVIGKAASRAGKTASKEVKKAAKKVKRATRKPMSKTMKKAARKVKMVKRGGAKRGGRAEKKAGRKAVKKAPRKK